MKLLYICECCGDLMRVEDRGDSAVVGDELVARQDLVCVEALCGECKAELGLEGGSILDSLTSFIH